MADYIEMHILAKPIILIDERVNEDTDIPGIYIIHVAKGLKLPSTASAALDAFHSNVPVGSLEDFEFTVFDPSTGMVIEEDPDHESYSKTHLAKCGDKLSDKLPELFEVIIQASNEEEIISIGKTTVVANDEDDANRKALHIHWDDRLDTTGHSPIFNTRALTEESKPSFKIKYPVYTEENKEEKEILRIKINSYSGIDKAANFLMTEFDPMGTGIIVEINDEEIQFDEKEEYVVFAQGIMMGSSLAKDLLPK
jgi:hypothetical protein